MPESECQLLQVLRRFVLFFPAGANPNLDRYLTSLGNLRGDARSPAWRWATAVLNRLWRDTVSSTQACNDNQYLARLIGRQLKKTASAFRYVLDDQAFN